jgi:serine/threonine protein kinase
VQHRAWVVENQAVVDTSPRPSPLASPSGLAPGPGLAPPSPPPGLRLGDYELLERVGAGGMAEVWMARRAPIPGGVQPCALKIIHGRFCKQDRYQRMFLQEARLALKLRHANVVSVLDAGEADGRLYMALEWVDGVHLRDFGQRVRARMGPLPVPLVCHVVGELLQGLRHAHGLRVGDRPLGVVHRDVAPHNVLVSSAGEVKLADFGIARVVGELSSGEHVKGRARYMAPEQLHGEPTQASDLFAVGGILHELLDGRRFREGLERHKEWHRVVAEAPLPPLHRADVPAALEALRVGLLQPDPERRIASADEALGWMLRCPPWPAGATTLRQLYARCVGAARRTGLTDPDAVRPRDATRPSSAERRAAATSAPPVAADRWAAATPSRVSADRWVATPAPPVAADRWTAAMPAPLAAADRWAAATPWAAAPTSALPASTDRWTRGSRLGLTATLQARDRPASLTPTPTRSTDAARPARGCEALVIRRRSAPRAFRPPVRPDLRWLGRGLWLVAACLAVVAAALALAPGRPRLQACIHEAPVAPAERARLRLRGDGQPLAQVRIDMQTLEVGSRSECWLSPGLHELAWRPSAAEPWRPVGSHTLISAKEHLVRVGEDGLAITAYDP